MYVRPCVATITISKAAFRSDHPLPSITGTWPQTGLNGRTGHRLDATGLIAHRSAVFANLGLYCEDRSYVRDEEVGGGANAVPRRGLCRTGCAGWSAIVGDATAVEELTQRILEEGVAFLSEYASCTCLHAPPTYRW